MGQPTRTLRSERTAGQSGQATSVSFSGAAGRPTTRRPKWTCTSSADALKRHLSEDVSRWGCDRLFRWDESQRGKILNTRTGHAASVINPSERVEVQQRDMKVDELIAGAAAAAIKRRGWDREDWPDDEGHLGTDTLTQVLQTAALITVKATWETWGEKDASQHLPDDGFALAAETLWLLEDDAESQKPYLVRWFREFEG